MGLPLNVAIFHLFSLIMVTLNVAKSQQDVPPDSELCLCDLRVNQCDPGCCCDQNCTTWETESATACLPSHRVVETRLCTQIRSTCSTTSSPACSTSTFSSASPFCIQFDNSGAVGRYFSPSRLLNESSLSLRLSQRATPTFTFLNSSASRLNSSTQHRSGDPIVIENNTLMLPWNVFGEACSNNNPAGFLMDRTRTCVQILTDSAAACSQGGVLDSNRLKNTSSITVVRRQIKVQNRDVVVMGTNTGINSSAHINGSICNNALMEARFTVNYDSFGHVSSTVEVTLGSISKNSGSLRQDFSVTHKPVDQEPVSVSGNPGYVVGKPLRVGILQGNVILERSGGLGGFLTVPLSSLPWSCVGGRGAQRPILFGVNARTGCRLGAAAGRATAFCLVEQEAVLREPNSTYWVPAYGNASNTEPVDWLPVLRTTNGVGCTQAACGQALANEVCGVDVAVRLFWTQVGSQVNPQAKLLGVQVNTCYYTAPQCPSRDWLDLVSSVTFVRRESPRLLAERALPVIDARLPTDFFFPFMQSPSNAPARLTPPAHHLATVMAAAAMLPRLAGA